MTLPFKIIQIFGYVQGYIAPNCDQSPAVLLKLLVQLQHVRLNSRDKVRLMCENHLVQGTSVNKYEYVIDNYET